MPNRMKKIDPWLILREVFQLYKLKDTIPGTATDSFDSRKWKDTQIEKHF